MKKISEKNTDNIFDSGQNSRSNNEFKEERIKYDVLIVDDNDSVTSMITNLLTSLGYSSVSAESGKQALEKVTEYDIKTVIMDYKLPDEFGDVVLKKIKNIYPDIPIIMLTAFADIKKAVETIKLGAIDYITKPFKNEDLITAVVNSIKQSSGKKEVYGLSENEKTNLEEIIFGNAEMQDILKQIRIVAPTEMTVLITGESGTGKEIAAMLIRNLSLRKDKKFITVDCGALTESLIESELFGHEKGAFTDAKYTKIGEFELANNGTIFLDEISNLSDSSQVKLLRALESRKITRVGGSVPIDLNVRIICATNTDLNTAINNNKFRSDLYYRLNEFHIKLPPLRERKDEIPKLINLFIKYANNEMNRNVTGVSDSVLNRMLDYSWPGNIRELRNNIRRAVLLNEGNLIDNIDNFEFTDENKYERELLEKDFNKLALKTEKDIITNALIITGGNKTKAAKFLNMNLRTLYRKIKKHNIEMNSII